MGSYDFLGKVQVGDVLVRHSPSRNRQGESFVTVSRVLKTEVVAEAADVLNDDGSVARIGVVERYSVKTGVRRGDARSSHSVWVTPFTPLWLGERVTDLAVLAEERQRVAAARVAMTRLDLALATLAGRSDAKALEQLAALADKLVAEEE